MNQTDLLQQIEKLALEIQHSKLNAKYMIVSSEVAQIQQTGLWMQRKNAVVVGRSHWKFLDEMTEWCGENKTGMVMRAGLEFVFEHEQDCVLFLLKWS